MSHYETAIQNLRAYNQELASGTAQTDTRPDNSNVLFVRIASDIGSKTDALYERAAAGSVFSLGARADYFSFKGMSNAYCLVMKAVEKDFQKVLAEQSAEALFQETKHAICEAGKPNPPLVLNGDPEGIFANHLTQLAGDGSKAQNKLQSLQRALVYRAGR